MAASVKVAERLRFPLGAASHTVSGSNQICSDPRGLWAALWDRKFGVRQVGGLGLGFVLHSD